MSTGIRLKEWRKSNGLKTTDIIKDTGISAGALSNYENDKREISSNFLLKIKEIYNADIYYILTGVKQDSLTDNEKELIDNYKKLSEKEQIEILGIVKYKAAQSKEQPDKSSNLKLG